MKCSLFLRRLVYVLVLACTVSLPQGCGKPSRPGTGEKLWIGFDWKATDSREGIGPRFTVWGGEWLSGTVPIERPALWITRPKKMVDGVEYSALVIYSGEKAHDKVPEARALELSARCLTVGPTQIVDIRLWTRVRCGLAIDHFENGVLRLAGTPQIIKGPYVFGPGDHHLQAMGVPTENLIRP